MTQQQDILTPHGYHGRYLRIDVGTGRHESVPLPDHVLRSFLGGTGLGVYLMFQEGQATVDAFDPAAALAFTFSPLVGSPLSLPDGLYAHLTSFRTFCIKKQKL